MDKKTNNNIIYDLGLELLSPEQQEEALISIGQIIFQAVIIRVLDILSDEEKDDFEKLLAGNSSEEMILNFLKSKIEDLDEIIKEEVENFKKESSELMGKIR